MTRLLLASASPARRATLRAAGIEPVVTVSDVDEHDVLAGAVAAAGALSPADAVLVYSAKAAQALQALTSRPTLQRLFEKTWFFALSARIAAALDGIAGERLRIAEQPDEETLLALLQARR